MDIKKPNFVNTVFLGASVDPEVKAEIDRRAAETGNRSFVVNRLLKQALGLDENHNTQEPELKAS